MAAALKFYAGTAYGSDITGSGLGFYGSSGFGTSVQVGQYQDTTFITNGAGSVNAGTALNAKFIDASGASINGGGRVDLDTLPIGSGTLNVRFTFDSAVKTQNCELRIYDRTDEDNDPSGVTCKVAQICQGGSGVSSSGTLEAAHGGFEELAGSGTVMVLLASPGESGLTPSGVDTEDDRHDWYAALSASPDSIGSKTAFGLWVELEYL